MSSAGKALIINFSISVLSPQCTSQCIRITEAQASEPPRFSAQGALPGCLPPGGFPSLLRAAASLAGSAQGGSESCGHRVVGRDPAARGWADGGPPMGAGAPRLRSH